MKRANTFRLSGIAIALAAAFGPAHAVDPIAPENVPPRAPAAVNTEASTASVGVGYTADNGRRFGQYNGINEDGFYGLLDFNWVRRNDETGTWTRFFGRDVGLDDRQLRFEQQRQGNWGYTIDYTRVPRFEPLIANTAVAGIGSNTLVMPNVFTPNGGATELKTKRDILGLGFEKYFAGNWDVQLFFRNEEKEGTRIFGRGTTGTPASGFCTCEFGPEPIKANLRQVEAKLNYNGGALLLTGGYYGTMYNNDFDSGLNFIGGNPALAAPAAPNSPFTPIALPPDNQSHQVYVSGNYAFSSTTRSTFKLAYGRITQDAPFIVPPAAGLPNQLDGRIDTTLAQIGVTSRPMPKLSVIADLRYENRDDKTPVRDYFTNTQTSTSNGDNEPRSIKTTTAKVEANYALPEGFRIIGGVAWDEKERNISPIHVVSARETTDETTWRVELRRPMSETVTGSIAFLRSDRSGSDFVPTTVVGGGIGSNLIAPIFLADRERDKVRVTVNWQPTNPLTVQLVADTARDNYEGRDPVLGPRNGEAKNLSLDAAYVFSDRWQANAWYSYTDTSLDQTTCQSASSTGVCATTALTWSAAIRNLSNSFGVGMRGKPTGQIEFGFDFSYSEIKDENHLSAVSGTGTVTTLPDVTTKLTRLNLFARYALQKNSGIRLDYIYDRFESDDFTWPTWVFADGTRLSEPPSQNVSFIGVSYYYKFQ